VCFCWFWSLSLWGFGWFGTFGRSRFLGSRSLGWAWFLRSRSSGQHWFRSALRTQRIGTIINVESECKLIIWLISVHTNQFFMKLIHNFSAKHQFIFLSIWCIFPQIILIIFNPGVGAGVCSIRSMLIPVTSAATGGMTGMAGTALAAS